MVTHKLLGVNEGLNVHGNTGQVIIALWKVRAELLFLTVGEYAQVGAGLASALAFRRGIL